MLLRYVYGSGHYASYCESLWVYGVVRVIVCTRMHAGSSMGCLLVACLVAYSHAGTELDGTELYGAGLYVTTLASAKPGGALI